MAENGGGRNKQSWLHGAYGAWRDMKLQTDNSGSIMFEPCVPPVTERIKEACKAYRTFATVFKTNYI